MFNLSMLSRGSYRAALAIVLGGPKDTGPSEEALVVVWGNDEGLSLSRGNGKSRTPRL